MSGVDTVSSALSDEFEHVVLWPGDWALSSTSSHTATVGGCRPHIMAYLAR